jgi:thymidylate synthase ThyX
VEQFTDEDKKLILPFFTNLDKPVFCLINLPEVVKGALFSRYSRTTKSLRRVLLDEFISKPEMKFNEIVGTAAPNQIVATKKAEEFYDRVLVGYGDDSVAELGGAHMACEEVSQLATKALEDSRIGLSPLEKSTRYVRFDDKVDGQYRYYKDPNIMKSEFADLYVKTIENLFNTYSKLIEPVMGFLMERIKKDEATSDRAYQSAIRAKACDILRGVLPAATLTNLGMFGNGRAFEYLITKMLTSPLAEVRNVATMMHEELSKVIPSFVKRATDKYGQETQKYLIDTRELMEKISQDATKNIEPEKSDYVTLVKFDPDAKNKVVAALLYPQSKLSMKQLLELAGKMSEKEKIKIIREHFTHRKNRRHKPSRALENVHYIFDILANFGLYRDLQRHRMLTQERQDLTVDYGYDIPKEIVQCGLQKEFEDAMNQAADVFRIISQKFPKQAQYVVPLAFRMRWYFTMSLREVLYLIELRSIQQGHPDYRKIVQQMFKLVKEVHPVFAEGMKFVDLNEYELERIESEKKIDKKMEEIKTKYGS